jgi:SAM-dependent methyltransferase
MSDPYQNADGLTKDTVDAIATRLEERGENPIFRSMIDDYLAVLPQGVEGLRVMDLGCGTGVVTRALRDHLADSAELYGVDLSETLLKKAQALAGDSQIQWTKAEVGPLPFEADSFDFVIMHTLLSHVPDLESCLRDTRRVLKSDGQLIIFDADYASTTFAYPDFEKMREIDLKLLSGLVTHLDVCRQLPRLLKGSGFRLGSHRSYLLSEAGIGDYWMSSVRSFAKLIPALGILPEAEGQAWVEHMFKSQEDETFFAAGAYYTYFCRPDKD